MAALDQALSTAHAQLLQAREELAQPPARSFQDALLEALRRPYEASALVLSSNNSSNSSRETSWRRSDLRVFLGRFFPQYTQQPAAFAALCASLARKDAKAATDRRKESEEQEDEALVTVSFDALKRVLVRQYGSTRLVAKDPFPLEPRVEPKPERRASIAPYVPGPTSGGTDNGSDDMSAAVLREFQAEVLKKSKSWLGRWRARHLLLRWGVLEMHKRSLAARSFRHVHSSGSSSGAAASGTSGRAGESSSSAFSTASQTPTATAAAAAANTKMYDLQDLVSLILEHVSDGDSASARKAALTLKFRTALTPASNSHSHPSATASQDIKTLVLVGGEASDTLVSIRDHIATFALYLELSRRDRLPSMTKVRRYIAAGAMVNVRVRIPRVSSSKESKDGSRRRTQAKQPPRGMVTALQLAFLQDPRVPSFESTIALLLNAGADPRSLLYWDYATQVVFSPPSSSGHEKKEKSEEHRQRRRLRKRLLLLDAVESDGDESASFPCCEVQADDAARWNLLMYFCWLGDVEGVKKLLVVTGAGSASGSGGRTSSRQLVTCLDHVNAAGDTALHIAIKVGKEAVALLLVEATLATNAQAVHQCDARGEPVVHLALAARQWRVVDALVAGGAVDPRSFDALGNTALHLAIQLRAPVALIARLIQVYRHSSPTGGLDGRAGRRGSNDTPLALALKSGQQEVVALLLASGASASGWSGQWSQAFVEKRKTRKEESAEEKGVVGEDDRALHVAIKAGMELAAAALIAHKADIYAVDTRGASSLALAVRYGLYALAAALVDQHQKKQSQVAGKPWWVDGETGRPVVMLALQAGQLELAALLLDCVSQDKDSPRLLHPARVLPLLVQLTSWVETGTDASASAGGRWNKSAHARRNSGGSVDAGDRKKARSSSSTWTRDRAKSRSDGDWEQLKKEASRRGGNDGASGHESPAKSKEDKDAGVFILGGIQALVVRFLHLCGTTSVTEVVGGGAMPASVSLSTLPLVVHLPTTAPPSKSSPPTVYKDDEMTAGSPLHVAASGGPFTASLLRLLLAFLLNADASAAAKVFVRPMGSRAETPLHAALGAGAAENALLLLYASRELQVRSPAVGPVCAQQLEMTNLLGDSALHLASAWPHSAAMRLVVELLLQEHVDAGNWNNAGLAPLHVALREGCDDTFIELFLRYGQDLNLWTEGNTYEDEEGDDEASEYFGTSGVRPSALTMVASCPQNPLMLALESENAAAFRALLAVHFNVRDPELLACLLDDPELEHSAQSDVADQWGVSPRDARSRLMDVWKKERSGVEAQGAPGAIAGTDSEVRQQQRPPPLHPASASGERLPYSLDYSSSVDAPAQLGETRVPPPLRIAVPRPPAESVPLETAQYLRALPRPPTLSPTTLEYLREEERATLTLVAQEARSEAQDWLAKRIGQKKLLSDAHAQLQSAKKHRRTASGSSVSSSSRDDLDVSIPDAGGGPVLSDQQLLGELKAAAAKKFIDKHVAEAVAEARLAIEREKQTIFQETGLFPGMTSASKKHKKKGDSRHRSLLVRAASSTTGSMLLPASSASVTSVSSEEGNSTQPSEDSYGSASFWWSERGTTSFGDDTSLSWLSSSNPRGTTMLSDPASASVSSWASNGRGTMLDGSLDRRLSFASRSFLESDDSGRHGKAESSTDSFVDAARQEHESDVAYPNPLDRASFPQVISERNTTG